MAPSMASSRLSLVALVSLFSLISLTGAANFLQFESATRKDVESALRSELMAATPGVDESADKRIAEFEAALRPTYAVLPKNAKGKLGHQAVRYVLHRMFVKRHGWFIRGLEPGNETWHEPSSSSKAGEVKEWVPNYLQALIESRLGGHGTDLPGLAAFAAALEDLVRQEARKRLTGAYELHNFSVAQRLLRTDAEEVISTYTMDYLVAGKLFGLATPQNVMRKKEIFSHAYSGYDESFKWLHELEDRRLPATGPVDFSEVERTVEGVGEEFYTFNDLECSSLKKTLVGMESRKEGRVRLSVFYSKGLYSHWKFTEKIDYLRALGALDESDPEQPHVILSNYVMARPNCLQASALYAVCCRNECEDFMGSLESAIGAPWASASRIASLVAAMPSDTTPAPRNLSAQLLSRLDQVAEAHGGLVPLHGRLFAQWMHHAFPRECPSPHQLGAPSPQTPDEWMKETGQAGAQASLQEMRHHVEADTCALDAKGCTEGSTDLPWSSDDMLLTGDFFPSGAEGQVLQGSRGISIATLVKGAALCSFIPGFALLYLALGRKRCITGALKLRLSLSCAGLIVVAYALGFLDLTAFAVAFIGCLVVTVMKFAAGSSRKSCESTLPECSECC